MAPWVSQAAARRGDRVAKGDGTEKQVWLVVGGGWGRGGGWVGRWPPVALGTLGTD